MTYNSHDLHVHVATQRAHEMNLTRSYLIKPWLLYRDGLMTSGVSNDT